MIQLVDFGALPQPVKIATVQAQDLAHDYTRVRNDWAQDSLGRRVVPPSRVGRIAQMLLLSDVPSLAGHRQAMDQLFREGHNPAERLADGRLVHATLAPVVLTWEAMRRAQDTAHDSIVHKAQDASQSTVTATQQLKPADELVQTLEWREVAPPGPSIQFGAVVLELPKLASTGKPEVRDSLKGKMPQFGTGMSVTTAKVGYIMGEMSTDALQVAQWGRSQVNFSQMLDAIAAREMEDQMGLLAYSGASEYGWSSALGTPNDYLTVKVDGTVALLVTGLLNVIDAYGQALGTSNLRSYNATYCQVSQKIAQRLRHPYGDASGRSGWEYIRAAYPNISFSESTVLDNMASGESWVVVGHRSGGGAGQAILGMQTLGDDRDMIMVYQAGLETRTLRLRSFAGTYSPYDELRYSAKFDTVT